MQAVKIKCTTTERAEPVSGRCLILGVVLCSNKNNGCFKQSYYA